MSSTSGGGFLVIAALVAGAVGCSRWADDLACHDEGCQFTKAEWERVSSLSGLKDPPIDTSNGLLVQVLKGAPPSPTRDEIVRLGWQLYYDPDFAGQPTWKDMLGRPSGTARASPLAPMDPEDKVPVSCATCHDPEHGGGDVTSEPRNIAVGAGWYDVNGQQTLNVAQYSYLYWNGRADSVWSQAAQVMESGVSVNGDRLAIVATVRAKYSAPFPTVVPGWGLPATSDFNRCKAVDDCPDSDCRVVTSTATGATACQPIIPPHGKRGNKVGCQWDNPDEPSHDAFDCMRLDDQTRVTRGYTNIAKAIAAYEYFLSSTDSPFDVFVREGPSSTALSPDAQRGLKLFVGRAGCIDCHRGPMFSDQGFHNIGVPQVGIGVPTVADCLRKDTASACDCKSGRKCLPWGACDGVPRLSDQPRPPPTTGPISAPGVADPSPTCMLLPPSPEPGPGEATRISSFEFNRSSIYSDDTASALAPPLQPLVKGSWRTPSLRDVALTAPYMHDGVFSSLADVVWHYDQGAAANDIGTVAKEFRPLHLSGGDRADLVAFLQSLTGKPRQDWDIARRPDSCPLYPAASDGGCGAGPGPPDAGASGQ